MGEVTTIGLDLAKRVFQVHGVDAVGAVVITRQVRRAEMLRFFSKRSPEQIGPGGCSCDLRGGHTAVNALRADEEHDAAGRACGAPGARTAGATANDADERPARSTWQSLGLSKRAGTTGSAN
jgi:hypothetical protein